jgi:predicted dehydrogenase
MNKELHFAIIGCGRIAQRHAQHIHNIGKLVAVCDIIETKAIDLAKQYNANPYSSIDVLLQENTAIDVVAICTPNGLHAQHSIKALHKGCHVVCEKPMAFLQ